MQTAELFRVEAVEITAPPVGTAMMDTEDSTEATWCRYVITNRASRVVGRYRGSLSQARRNAEQLASSFNDRLKNNRSAWSPRSTSRRKAPAKGKAAPVARRKA